MQRNREKIHRTEKRGKTKPGLNFFSVEMKVFVSDVTKETSKRGGRKKLPKFLVVPEASKMKTLLPDKLSRCKIRIGCSVRFLVADFGPKNQIECRGTRFVTSMKSNKAIGARVTALSQMIKEVYNLYIGMIENPQVIARKVNDKLFQSISYCKITKILV